MIRCPRCKNLVTQIRFKASEQEMCAECWVAEVKRLQNLQERICNVITNIFGFEALEKIVSILKSYDEVIARRVEENETVKFSGRVFQDGDFWLVEIPDIDAMTQGHTKEEAFEMVKDLVENFVNEDGFEASVFPNPDDTFEVTGSDPRKMEELYEKRRNK